MRAGPALLLALALLEAGGAPTAAVAEEPSHAARRPPRQRAPKGRWPARYRGRFELKDAELTTLARRISDITGRNVIVGDSAKGKVTLLGPTRVTRVEAWEAFLAALQSLELTVSRVGRFWRIVPLADGRGEPGPVVDTGAR